MCKVNMISKLSNVSLISNIGADAQVWWSASVAFQMRKLLICIIFLVSSLSEAQGTTFCLSTNCMDSAGNCQWCGENMWSDYGTNGYSGCYCFPLIQNGIVSQYGMHPDAFRRYPDPSAGGCDVRCPPFSAPWTKAASPCYCAFGYGKVTGV